MPAIVQDAAGGAVLMLGYMNREALAATRASGRVTFWSRSKGRLWTKGETSGNYLEVRSMAADCDGDTLLILARPAGPACHLGTPHLFRRKPAPCGRGAAGLPGHPRSSWSRSASPHPVPDSYTAKLLAEGPRRVAQKVGEEGVELALAAVAQGDPEIVGEAADLLYHMIVLLQSKHLSLAAVVAELEARHRAR